MTSRFENRIYKYIHGDNGNLKMVCGASLAHHGLLDAVKWLDLEYDDLSYVPAEHLASLGSCVTERVNIGNARGLDLVSIFTSLKCVLLSIDKQSLGKGRHRP